MLPPLPDDWARVLGDATAAPSYRTLDAFLDAERAQHEILPAADEVFAALVATPFARVHVLLLGQDPYPTPGHAHGLCFSVRPGVKPPASLVNIARELHTDLGIPPSTSGWLMPWARQGMLMLNTVLTVRAGEANSHRKRGWEPFTDAIIRAVNAKAEPVVFVLWGRAAQQKLPLIDRDRHAVVQGAHPSPLSAKRWFGSRPFSQIDAALARHGQAPFEWRLGDPPPVAAAGDATGAAPRRRPG